MDNGKTIAIIILFLAVFLFGLAVGGLTEQRSRHSISRECSLQAKLQGYDSSEYSSKSGCAAGDYKKDNWKLISLGE